MVPLCQQLSESSGRLDYRKSCASRQKLLDQTKNLYVPSALDLCASLCLSGLASHETIEAPKNLDASLSDLDSLGDRSIVELCRGCWTFLPVGFEATMSSPHASVAGRLTLGDFIAPKEQVRPPDDKHQHVPKGMV